MSVILHLALDLLTNVIFNMSLINATFKRNLHSKHNES